MQHEGEIKPHIIHTDSCIFRHGFGMSMFNSKRLDQVANLFCFVVGVIAGFDIGGALT